MSTEHVDCAECDLRFADRESLQAHRGSGGQCCHPPSRGMFGVVRAHRVIWTVHRPTRATPVRTERATSAGAGHGADPGEHPARHERR